MEDDLNFWGEMEDDINFLLNIRRTQFFMVVDNNKTKNNSVEIEAYLKPYWVLASTKYDSSLRINLKIALVSTLLFCM